MIRLVSVRNSSSSNTFFSAAKSAGTRSNCCSFHSNGTSVLIVAKHFDILMMSAFSFTFSRIDPRNSSVCSKR